MLKSVLRKESSSQDSGKVNLESILILPTRHYYIIDIPLDGDAPKQYIKAYFYYKNCPRKKDITKWPGHFAKFGGKSYPHESIIEFLVNKIGEYLELNMNKTRLVIVNDQIRFLSQDFIGKNQRLIHGIEILAEYFEDKDFVDEINKDRKNRRRYFTFEVIERAIKHVYPLECKELLKNLVRLITFDAIVGNNDRHFYNWGVIGSIIESKNKKVVFSPIYDSARALLWNKTEDSMLKMHEHFIAGSNEIDYYLNKSKPRFSFENKPDANHFELIEWLKGYNSTYNEVILDLISIERENTVIGKLNKQTYSFFSKERCILMGEILKKRFKRLRIYIP